jgi:protein phosphatase
MAEFFQLTGRDEEATWPFKLDPALGYEQNRIATAVKLANLRIHERAQSDPKLKGMGTTIVAASVPKGGRKLIVAHVGDSRVYLWRGGAIRQLTEDHSLLNDYLRTKKLTPAEVESFPHKNVIVRALGMKPLVEVDVLDEELRDGDVVLLCCDGMVPDALMAEIIQNSHGDLRRAAHALVDAANDGGGVDNITCVLVAAQG